MNEWVGECMDRWLHGWMGGWVVKWMDGQMYGRTDGPFQSTSGPLPVNFQSTSGSLPVLLGTIGGHMRHDSYSLPKKMNFAKFADGRTYGRKKSDF